MINLQRLTLTALLGLAACAPTYTLITAAPVAVARNTIHVTPGTTWNKAPRTPLDVAWEENWTQNGPRLDAITFIGGLPDGQAVAKQRRKSNAQVPVFHATMSPQDLTSMIESYHRLRAGATVFETKGVVPITFVGKPGFAFDYAFVGQDQVKRFGRSVVAIDGGKLYMMTLDATALHYFNVARPEFDAMTASATLR